jgi:hypothetical protein
MHIPRLYTYRLWRSRELSGARPREWPGAFVGSQAEREQANVAWDAGPCCGGRTALWDFALRQCG